MSSPTEALAIAFRDTILDQDTPQNLRDKLVLVAAELRDILSEYQARWVAAAEAEAVINSFSLTGQTLFPELTAVESLSDGLSLTSAAQSKRPNSQ